MHPVRFCLIVGSLVLLATLGLIAFEDRTRSRQTGQPHAPPGGSGLPPTPFVWAGIVQPTVVSAAKAGLKDEEAVIGVIVKGKARAYRVQALEPLTGHVVNDLLDNVPVTVTHCDRTGCSRVFTGEGREPLPVMVGGYAEGLLLKVEGRFYHQSTGLALDNPDAPPLPYRELKVEQTTWKEWRRAHPETDIYVGGEPAEKTNRPPGL